MRQHRTAAGGLVGAVWDAGGSDEVGDGAVRQAVLHEISRESINSLSGPGVSMCGDRRARGDTGQNRHRPGRLFLVEDLHGNTGKVQWNPVDIALIGLNGIQRTKPLV